MREITHRRDAGGHMRQIVTPERLREILDADGESYDPPIGFGPDDEWQVSDGDGSCDESAEENQTHWGYGSGMPGCLFDHGPHCADTQDDAINAALGLFSETGDASDLTESELEQARADLKADGIHYFPADRRAELGASLVQVWEESGPCPDSDE